MKEVYKEQCHERCTIFQWCQRYEAGRVYIKDLSRPRQAHVVTDSATTSAVDELIRQNRRITTREIAVELPKSKGTVHQIIHKKKLLKVMENFVHSGCPSICQRIRRRRESMLPDAGVSTLKPSTPFLRAGISVSMSMAIINSCTIPHEL
ncbi:hypothetical protein AVEN_70468-1 [Araneus ventricosus]|uniref:Mos1 transposase HTH domain-containing protein n=1 Tax=Araneus ventricosus TaxID=182803 RepID=A0A4Y2XAJ2_ARAVE|nr:hypothetical protein AVEN_70468-1 [Araneus ventricosus]